MRQSELYNESDYERIIALLRPHNLIPVFVDNEIFKKFYFGYCKSYLWPIIHNIVNVYGEYVKVLNPDIIEKYWDAYIKCNKLISLKLIEE